MAAQLLGVSKEAIYEKINSRSEGAERSDIRFSATEREKEQMNSEVAARISGQSSKFSRKHRVKPQTTAEVKDDTIYWDKIAQLSQNAVADIWALYFSSGITTHQKQSNLD